jgi:uncharacterized protein (TIGR01777 family)
MMDIIAGQAAAAPKTVAVTGASGFVGRAVVAALRAHGHRVVALSRTPPAGAVGVDIEWRAFDPAAGANPTAFAGTDAVIHLAGEPVEGRWTPSKKAAIRSSRVDGTRAVVASLAACAPRPRALLCASAVGYYGTRGAEPLIESSAPGDTFLAQVCVEWERAADEAHDLGIRVAMLRIGIVVGQGGAIAAMRTPFLWGAGGPFGMRRRFVPWIHIDDLARLFVFALERDDVHGALNAVAPDYATSARFAHALGAALRRPAVVPAPSFALRALLGEFADVLLSSQLVLPAAAEDAGFAWRFLHLEEAMLDVAGGGGVRSAAIHRFRGEQLVPVTLKRAFAFFSDPANLEAITPPTLHFAIVSLPNALDRAALISYRLRLRGFPIAWTTMIARWLPGREFVDVQLRGPYMLWRHRHTFEDTVGGVVIRDEVDYILPLAPLGNLALPLVRADVEAIFRYRREAISRMLL